MPLKILENKIDKICKIQEILKLQQFKTKNSTTNIIAKSYLIIQNPDITKADPKIQQKLSIPLRFKTLQLDCVTFTYLWSNEV